MHKIYLCFYIQSSDKSTISVCSHHSVVSLNAEPTVKAHWQWKFRATEQMYRQEVCIKGKTTHVAEDAQMLIQNLSVNVKAGTGSLFLVSLVR